MSQRDLGLSFEDYEKDSSGDVYRAEHVKEVDGEAPGDSSGGSEGDVASDWEEDSCEEETGACVCLRVWVAQNLGPSLDFAWARELACVCLHR